MPNASWPCLWGKPRTTPRERRPYVCRHVGHREPAGRGALVSRRHLSRGVCQPELPAAGGHALAAGALPGATSVRTPRLGGADHRRRGVQLLVRARTRFRARRRRRRGSRRAPSPVVARSGATGAVRDRRRLARDRAAGIRRRRGHDRVTGPALLRLSRRGCAKDLDLRDGEQDHRVLVCVQ